MEAVVDVALPVFAVMAAGWLAGRTYLLGPASSEALNAFVYWFALPPLLFLSMAQVPLPRILAWDYIAVFCLGIVATAVPALLVGRHVFANRGGALSRHVMVALFANTGYMGIPLFLAAFGPEGTLPAVIATVINGAVVTGLAIFAVDFGENAGAGVRRALLQAGRAVATAPLPLAPLAGIAWQVAGLPLPTALVNLAGLLGASAGPCALFAMGLFLVGKPLAAGAAEIGWRVAVKLLVQPLATWALALWVIPLDGEWLRGAVLMAALPTGALAFVVAQRYGVYVQRSSAAILATTVGSVVTLSALLVLLGMR
ncbi:MAG: AEC family transporter [Alphaproteobacteria bacterium]|nr:AEC family transporter [Alphaproteobacteria bacterium]